MPLHTLAASLSLLWQAFTRSNLLLLFTSRIFFRLSWRRKRLIGFYLSGFIKRLTIFMPEIIATFFTIWRSIYSRSKSWINTRVYMDYRDRQTELTHFESRRYTDLLQIVQSANRVAGIQWIKSYRYNIKSRASANDHIKHQNRRKSDLCDVFHGRVVGARWVWDVSETTDLLRDSHTTISLLHTTLRSEKKKKTHHTSKCFTGMNIFRSADWFKLMRKLQLVK